MTDIASKELIVTCWILILIYMGIIIFFVIRGALRTKNITDYAVGNIAFSPIFVGLSLAASMTSAATFIINPGFIALYGISGVVSYAVVVPLAAMTSLIILTKGFHKYGVRIKALTMAQWIGSRYKSSGYSLLFGFLSLLLITFIVLIVVGLTKILSKALNVQELYILIGIVFFIFGYMMFGGANSLVYTNTIQAALMLIVAFILLGSGYEHFSNGIHGFLTKLRTIDPNLATLTNPNSYLFRDYFEIIFCQIIVGVAIVCQPHIITRSFFLKTDKDVNKFLITGVIAELIFFFVVTAGLYARIVFPDLTVNGAPLKMDGIMSAYVIREFPVYVGLVVVMGLISAGVSTLEGLIQAVSTTITADIVKPLFGKYFPDDERKKSKLEVLLNKIAIILLAIVTVFIAYDQLINPNLSVGIFAQNGVYAYFAAAFVPVLFGSFFKNVPKTAPILASITAIVVHFMIYYGGITHYMKTPVKNPAIAAAIAILCSIAVGLILFLIFKERQQQAEKAVLKN